MEATQMNTKPILPAIDLRSVIMQRDKSLDTWSIHVDEIKQWHPRYESFDSWFEELCDIYSEAKQIVTAPEIVVVALSFEPSVEIETFQSLQKLSIDYFTPPSLYLLKSDFAFPAAGEEYFRVLYSKEIGLSLLDSTVIARSSRTLEGLQQGWEFDNTIYISSRFGN
jgi:hypothetical protein